MYEYECLAWIHMARSLNGMNVRGARDAERVGKVWWQFDKENKYELCPL